MSLDDIIRAWKSDEQSLEPHLPTSPVGRELSEEELLDVLGSGCYNSLTCSDDPQITCVVTCGGSSSCNNTTPCNMTCTFSYQGN